MSETKKPKKFMPHEIMSLEILDETTLFVRAEALDAANAEIARLKTELELKHFYKPARENIKDLQSQLAAANAKLEIAVEKLKEVNEFTSSILEDMEHYFDNKCCPTVDEVNQCAIADSHLRIAIGKIQAPQTEEK